jgi:hypothetical protein
MIVEFLGFSEIRCMTKLIYASIFCGRCTKFDGNSGEMCDSNQGGAPDGLQVHAAFIMLFADPGVDKCDSEK